jgi:RimJ/RimL family protein N-acetyltransferase
MVMANAASYSAIEALPDGRSVEIRAVRPADRDGFIEAFGRASPASIYRRFFAAKRDLSEQEISFFSDVDFVGHVALVAVAAEGGRPVVVGGARYITVEPGQAEIAFTVLDQYQGHGLGAALMRHLVMLAREAGLKQLIAEVLPENTPMLKVFEKCGLQLNTRRERGVVHVTLRLS